MLFPCFKQWLNTQTLLQNSAIKEETKIDDYEKDSTHYIYFTDSHDTSGTKQTHYERKKPTPNCGNRWRRWRRNLPKSASEIVNTILKQAVGDKNSPEVIKALIHQGKYDLLIDAENDTLMFYNLKQMLATTTDVVEQAVINSMLADLYLQYYNKDRWTIDQRTQLADFVPADMKEWTKNNFLDRVVMHANASLSEQAKLEHTEVKTYATIVNLKEDSREFYPTLFDFLALRALDVLKEMDSDQDLSRSLSKANIEKETIVCTCQ